MSERIDAAIAGLSTLATTRRFSSLAAKRLTST